MEHSGYFWYFSNRSYLVENSIYVYLYVTFVCLYISSMHRHTHKHIHTCAFEQLSMLFLKTWCFGSVCLSSNPISPFTSHVTRNNVLTPLTCSYLQFKILKWWWYYSSIVRIKWGDVIKTTTVFPASAT